MKKTLIASVPVVILLAVGSSTAKEKNLNVHKEDKCQETVIITPFGKVSGFVVDEGDEETLEKCKHDKRYRKYYTRKGENRK
jgi:hypothetical protein